MPLVKSPSLKKMGRGVHDAESSDPAGDPREIETEGEKEKEREMARATGRASATGGKK